MNNELIHLAEVLEKQALITEDMFEQLGDLGIIIRTILHFGAGKFIGFWIGLIGILRPKLAGKYVWNRIKWIPKYLKLIYELLNGPGEFNKKKIRLGALLSEVSLALGTVIGVILGLRVLFMMLVRIMRAMGMSAQVSLLSRTAKLEEEERIKASTVWYKRLPIEAKMRMILAMTKLGKKARSLRRIH